MDNAPLVNSGSVPADAPERDFFAPLDAAQLELFPELCDERLPKRFAALRSSDNFRIRFVYHFFMTKNATKSVMLAGSKCTEESARRIGSKLLTSVDIQNALRFFGEKVEAECLVSAQDVLLDIMENRERAKNPGDGKRPDFRAVNEANRMLGQFKKMFGAESVNANVVAFSSFAELEKFAESRKKEGLKNEENEQE